MGKIIDKMSSLLPTNSNGDIIIPNKVTDSLRDIGSKGGEKYSNLVDIVVDFIFKKGK